MADYREILHERLYVKVPGTYSPQDRRQPPKHLLANGWRELERQQRADHVMVTFERTGHAPMKARLPKPVAEVRIERRPRRDDNAAAAAGADRREEASGPESGLLRVGDRISFGS